MVPRAPFLVHQVAFPLRSSQQASSRVRSIRQGRRISRPSKSFIRTFPFWSPCPSIRSLASRSLSSDPRSRSQHRVAVRISHGIPSSIYPLVPTLGHSPSLARPHSHVPFSNRKRLEDYQIEGFEDEDEAEVEKRKERGTFSGGSPQAPGKARERRALSCRPRPQKRRASVTWEKSHRSDLSPPPSGSETTHTPSLRALSLLSPSSLLFLSHPPFQLSPRLSTLSSLPAARSSSSSAPASGSLCQQHALLNRRARQLRYPPTKPTSTL
jgi:hypothetical protein